MIETKFTACKNLEFDQSKYSVQLALINSGGTTKGVWERRDPDGKLQLCQFCKLNGRHNGPECCLESLNAECGDYEDYEHTINNQEVVS
jgi:hypothetical protein